MTSIFLCSCNIERCKAGKSLKSFHVAGPDAWDLCYGAKPFSSGDEQEDELTERQPVRRRRKKRQKTKYNLRQLENQADRKLAAQFWKQNKTFAWKGSCYSIQNTICSVKLERVAEPVESRAEGLSSDSVDDLIKSSSCSEGRASSVGLLSSNDESASSMPTQQKKGVLDSNRIGQKNIKRKSPTFPARVVDDDGGDIKPILGPDGGVLANRCEEDRVDASLGDIDIIELLGSSDTSVSSEKDSPEPTSAAVWDAHTETDLESLQSGRKDSAQEGTKLPDDGQIESVPRESSSDVDILELISSDHGQEEEVAAPIIHLTAVGMEEKSQVIPGDQRLVASDDEDYVAVMTTAKNAAKKETNQKKNDQPSTRVMMRCRPGPACSKKGIPSVVYDLSSDDEANLGQRDDEGNEADIEDDVVDVSDNEDGNSYLDHKSSSSEDYDSDGNSYLEHRGDSSDEPNDGCGEDCDNSDVIEEEEAVCIVGEIRNETIEDEEEEVAVENSNKEQLVVQTAESEREKVNKENNVIVETIDEEEENVPSSSPAPFVISEVRTGIGTEAENDWDDILVEEIDARQSSVEPECTPRSRFNHHLSSSSEHLARPTSSGGPEVVRLSPPREVVEPEITLLPISSRPKSVAPSSTGRGATSRHAPQSSTRPVFQSSFAGIAPRPPVASSSKQLLLEPPEQQGFDTRSRRSMGKADTGQVSRERPGSEWDAIDTHPRGSGGGASTRRQEWDTGLRLNTVADSSRSSVPTPKRKGKKQRGKKPKASAKKQDVRNASADTADQSIDVYLDNDDEVEALD